MSPAPASSSRRASPLRYVVLAAVAVAIAVAGYFALNGKSSVPDATFTLLSGQKVSTSSDLKGKVYLVNFWATSCETCMKEMPQMVQTYNRFKGQGLEFVAVAMNYDPPMYVANYAQTRQLPFKVALDDGCDRQAVRQRAAHADHLRGRQGRQDPQALCRRAAVRRARPTAAEGARQQRLNAAPPNETRPAAPPGAAGLVVCEADFPSR